MTQNTDRLADQLGKAGAFFFSRGWVPATSGNFSARIDEEQCLMTASGRHKGYLCHADFLRVEIASSQSVEESKTPSAEAALHTLIYQRFPEVGAVLHTHSVAATVLSRLARSELRLEEYELLKAFEGIDTHETAVDIPVLGNDQDIRQLAIQVDAHLRANPEMVGFLIRGHGLYTWGAAVSDAVRHIEALEFMFDCELSHRRIAS
ncbi:MAG: methylthioribulose 1-phosphate dehydratase [Halothiobacillaceae bacterium]